MAAKVRETVSGKESELRKVGPGSRRHTPRERRTVLFRQVRECPDVEGRVWLARSHPSVKNELHSRGAAVVGRSWRVCYTGASTD